MFLDNIICLNYVLNTTIRKQTQIRHEPSYKQLEVKTRVQNIAEIPENLKYRELVKRLKLLVPFQDAR
jgi:hypothetical protein